MEYITFCMGTVTVVKCIPVFPNQKSWMTTEARLLLKSHNTAFRLEIKVDLRRGIRKAKLDYRRKMENKLSNNNPH